MSETRACGACGGTGRIVIGAGLVALETLWPEMPIREMAKRGWIDVGDGEDVARCDAAFLAFWGAKSHGEIRQRFAARTLP